MMSVFRFVLIVGAIAAALGGGAAGSVWLYQQNRLWSHERPLEKLLGQKPPEQSIVAQLGRPWATVSPATASSVLVNEWWPSGRSAEIETKLRAYPRTLLYVEAPGLPRESVVDFIFLDASGHMASFVCIRN